MVVLTTLFSDGELAKELSSSCEFIDKTLQVKKTDLPKVLQERVHAALYEQEAPTLVVSSSSSSAASGSGASAPVKKKLKRVR